MKSLKTIKGEISKVSPQLILSDKKTKVIFIEQWYKTLLEIINKDKAFLSASLQEKKAELIEKLQDIKDFFYLYYGVLQVDEINVDHVLLLKKMYEQYCKRLDHCKFILKHYNRQEIIVFYESYGELDDLNEKEKKLIKFFHDLKLVAEIAIDKYIKKIN